MAISKGFKVLIGLTALWVSLFPFLYVASWFLFMFGVLFAGLSGGDESIMGLISLMLVAILVPLQILTAILKIALSIFFLWHIIRNTGAPEWARVLSGVGTFYMPFLALPVYYFLYIWPDSPAPPDVIPASSTTPSEPEVAV